MFRDCSRDDGQCQGGQRHWPDPSKGERQAAQDGGLHALKAEILKIEDFPVTEKVHPFSEHQGDPCSGFAANLRQQAVAPIAVDGAGTFCIGNYLRFSALHGTNVSPHHQVGGRVS